MNCAVINYSQWYSDWYKKYCQWITECATLINSYQNTEIRKRKAIGAVILQELTKRKYSKKKCWVSPLYKARNEKSFFNTIFPILCLEDLTLYSYLRMSATQLESLIQLVGADIHKMIMVREPISVSERLVITLRFLASGDSIHSLSYQYLVGITTISNIIKETCEAIWNNLHMICLKPDISSDKWLSISQQFENKWNFPHCVGAIDGKHVNIECPRNAGSAYYNYKGRHSIILLAVCDANYQFLFFDVGSYGRRSDGGIFHDSILYRKLENNRMNIPLPNPLHENGVPLPYVLLGDEAFPLKTYLLTPYPGKSDCTLEKRVFNYRLSRARRTIENCFGILATQWRIYRKNIDINVENCIKLIKATLCLHNWLRMADLKNKENLKYVTKELVDHESTKGFLAGSAFRNLSSINASSTAKEAAIIREHFCTYFNNEGALAWQYAYV